MSLEIGLLNNLIIKLNKHYSLSLNLNYFRYTDVNVGITIEEHPTSTENHTFKVFDGVVDCNKRTYDDLKELLIRIETMLAVLDIDTIKKVLIE